MDAAAVERRLRGAELAPGYLRPDDAYAFANVPATAAAALGVDLGRTVPADAVADRDGVEHVVVLVVDGFGWAQWTRDTADHELLRRLAARGTVTPLTTGYPSETAACMTTFHTGLSPARHGLIGWDVYVEALETVVQPLPFRTADGDPLDDVAGSVPADELLFAGESIYADLRAAGVEPVVVQPAGIDDSPYSKRVLAGADVRPYESPAELARAVRTALEADGSPRYVHAYHTAVDAAAHREGTDSAAHREALAALSTALEAELVGSLDPAVAETALLLVTADHGEVDTDPATNVNLDDVDGVRERLRRTPDGAVVPPTGGPRNVHLHVRPGEADALRTRLERSLDALVLARDEALDAGLFGDAEPSALFERRAGDLLVVPRDRSVWHGARPDGLAFVGMHGGLHPSELLVPLASARLSALRD